MAIPKIKEQDIIAALKYIDENGVPSQNQSTKYELVMGLSRRLKSAYMICFPSGELTDVETAKAQFYLAIRSIIYKQTKGDAPDAEVMNSVVEEILRSCAS